MLYYLDTVIVIYAVEGNPADKKRAKDHLDALEQAGHRFAISELTRTECLVPVFGPGAVGGGCVVGAPGDGAAGAAGPGAGGGVAGPGAPGAPGPGAGVGCAESGR